MAAVLLCAGCGNARRLAPADTVSAATRPANTETRRHVARLTGVVQAVRAYMVQAPEIYSQGGNLTLTHLVPNGATVRPGDVLAEFDATAEVKAAREAETKFDDLSHQIEQKIAENHSNAEKRASELKQAEADLEKAKLEIRKGPILSAIDDEKNKVKFEDAEQHTASLRRSGHYHDLAEAADLRILELQRDRQKVALDRARDNMQKLVIHAPIGGMVSLENVWKQGTMGHAEEGDQLWPGSGLLRIFDPSEMQILASVNEPDGALLKPGTVATVHLDAWPDLIFHAEFVSASPVAASQPMAPLKTFDAIFRFTQSDPHLLPDLSAALDIDEPTQAKGPNGA
ncbi:MAG TPA: efflux RND transporter periplasmic adaptor subunit [Bryobacteraceae bacterium]|nr:efflux RND transporter periplasmic adaptor subunit [Bryobacteraceae bacterium]